MTVWRSASEGDRVKSDVRPHAPTKLLAISEKRGCRAICDAVGWREVAWTDAMKRC